MLLALASSVNTEEGIMSLYQKIKKKVHSIFLVTLHNNLVTTKGTFEWINHRIVCVRASV